MLVDCTGKLNEHSEYLRVLKLLESKCEYMEYTLVDEDDRVFADKFKDNIISAQRKNEWQGTKQGGKGSEVLRLRADKAVFAFLRRYETFCKYHVEKDKCDVCEWTDFGINDIAFFDGKGEPLLFTTTHEGYIAAREDILGK